MTKEQIFKGDNWKEKVSWVLHPIQLFSRIRLVKENRELKNAIRIVKNFREGTATKEEQAKYFELKKHLVDCISGVNKK